MATDPCPARPVQPVYISQSNHRSHYYITRARLRSTFRRCWSHWHCGVMSEGHEMGNRQQAQQGHLTAIGM